MGCEPMQRNVRRGVPPFVRGRPFHYGQTATAKGTIGQLVSFVSFMKMWIGVDRFLVLLI